MSDDKPHPQALHPGLYDRLITVGLRKTLRQLPSDSSAHESDLPPERASHILAEHLASVAERLLSALAKGTDTTETSALLKAATAALESLNAEARKADRRPDDRPDDPLRLLEGITVGGAPRPELPLVPLSESALLVNEPGEPSLSAQLQRELASADRIDLLCAFVNWHGVRLLGPKLRAAVERGGAIRVITSTYMGVTQRRALDELVKVGAEVRVGYDTPPTRTRLHAKAWMFHRNSGYTTAYIGSSNLSHSALVEGVEWNVRLSSADAPGILKHFETTFERYWADTTFEVYDPERDGERLDRALGSYSAGRELEDRLDVFLDVTPQPHQRMILESLDFERTQRGNFRNLVVAATGTGKTVVAALDYRRLRRERGELPLLFVAHQERILQQARRQFRNVLREGSFGELWVDGARPQEWRHVFASIQSLTRDAFRSFLPEQFKMVILDEMHHVAARTYDDLMAFLKPEILLGLSATPERTDGEDTLKYFNGRVSAELRLWDALDKNLLCPFHYFGVPLDVDLRACQPERGSYRASDLERAYLDVEQHQRSKNILAELRRLAPDIPRMRALAFCVSVRHATAMAESFRTAGFAAEVLTGTTAVPERDRAVQALRRGELQVLFTVDLFNEGVDIPEVDTLLLLRPTSSATVFLQQLGRGLRLAEEKPCLTVLDFIGLQHQRFRFDRIYRSLTGLTLGELQHSVTAGFKQLPPGCHINLEREASDRILQSLRNAIPRTGPALVRELRSLGDIPLPTFLEGAGIEPGVVYANKRTFTSLRRAAGFVLGTPHRDEGVLAPALERLIDLDDPALLAWYQQVLSLPEAVDPSSLSLLEQRRLRMLLLTLWPEDRVVSHGAAEATRALWRVGALREELRQLCEVLRDRSHALPRRLDIPHFEEVPLQVHCRYSLAEVLAAIDVEKRSSVRQGVYYSHKLHCDVFFVTLRKHEKDYSPSTLYHDYFLSPQLLHWESQSITRELSATGQRYVHHRERCTGVLIFCREAAEADHRTARYVCLGPVDYVRHQSERPMQIVWELQIALPAATYDLFRAAAG